ncbi:TPM domain-containing protein [Macrococcoides canis]|uniref:TPM domain-containing protein n=1 Tax=Macrococcoides canis TaxID=1855823 RepID=UPI001B8B5B8F|nr:TPM domain-containing protein [Macrococcus canis]QUR94173.1 hypothetical protein GOY09_04025 [Macrococcus canis]UTH07313.1 TPM domain-containing protein [Macrococcus canis]
MTKKIIFIFLMLFYINPYAYANNIQKPDHYVYDEVGIVSDNTKARIEEYNNAASKNEPKHYLAVINSLNGETIEDVTMRMTEDWEISKETRYGTLTVIAIKDRKFRTATSNGLDRKYSSQEVKEDLNILVPYFREKDYDAGIYEYIDELHDSAVAATYEKWYETYASWLILGTVFLFVLIFTKISSKKDEQEAHEKLKDYKRRSNKYYEGNDKLTPLDTFFIMNETYTEEEYISYRNESYSKRSQFDYSGPDKLYPKHHDFVLNDSWKLENLERYMLNYKSDSSYKERLAKFSAEQYDTDDEIMKKKLILLAVAQSYSDSISYGYKFDGGQSSSSYFTEESFIEYQLRHEGLSGSGGGSSSSDSSFSNGGGASGSW